MNASDCSCAANLSTNANQSALQIFSSICQSLTTLHIQMNLSTAERVKGESDQYVIYLQRQIERFGAYIASQRDQQIEFQNTRSLIELQANQIKQLSKDIAQLQRQAECNCGSLNIEARLRVVQDSIIQHSQYSRSGNQIYPVFDSQVEEKETMRQRLQAIEEKIADKKSMKERNEMSQEGKIGTKDLLRLEQKICGYFGGKIETLEKMLNKEAKSRSISPIPSDHSSRLSDISSNNRVKREPNPSDSFKLNKVPTTKRKFTGSKGAKGAKENQSNRRDAIKINQFSTAHRSDAESGSRVSKQKAPSKTRAPHLRPHCNFPSHQFQSTFDGGKHYKLH